jgi:hypothetical protein
MGEMHRHPNKVIAELSANDSHLNQAWLALLREKDSG